MLYNQSHESSHRKYKFEINELVKKANVSHKPIQINSRYGKVLLVPMELSGSVMETLYIKSHPKTSKEILEAMKEPLECGKVYNPEDKW